MSTDTPQQRTIVDTKYVRTALEKLELPYTTDEEDNIVIVKSADQYFGHDIVIYIVVKNNRLSYVAGAPTFTPNGNLLEKANNFNCHRNLPVAVVRDGLVRMEYSYLLDEEVSDAYIVNNCIQVPISAILRAFCEFEQTD